MQLKFDISRIDSLPDGSSEILLSIAPEYQVYIGSFLEALNGLCYHTMIEIDSEENDTPVRKGMKITVTKDYKKEVLSLLNTLQGYEL